MKHKGIKYLSYDRPVQIICQPLMLTDLELLPDENIISINSGDTSRWLFQSIATQSDDQLCFHVLIKPKEPNLKTNLIVVTDKHTYYVELVSQKISSSKKLLAFFDPSINTSTTDLKLIDNDYRIKEPIFQKTPNWLPHYIYNDGSSVFISIPLLKSGVAPSFYVIDETARQNIVNYYLNDNIYQITQLFHKGLLVQGVGSEQKKLLIEHIEKRDQSYNE
jgi:type IV secretion system protein VirB9